MSFTCCKYIVVPNTLQSHKPPKFNVNAKLPQSNLSLINTSHATIIHI